MAVDKRLGTPGNLLERLADELDVSPSKYEDAKQRYDALGAHLQASGYELARYDPVIYPQGSFAIGTANKPIGDGDYDVDAVCLLHLSMLSTDQRQLKAMVGDRLKDSKVYARMLDPRDGGRRCWTLRYADDSQFHLDLLPAIEDDIQWLLALGVPEWYARHAICITDRLTWDKDSEWPKSNPKGYAEWFKDRMREVFNRRRRMIAEAKRADVETIPEYQVRTPLQRVIQLLKRHRDIRFADDKDKPISVIVTTLAAQAYRNEDDLGEALINVVRGMRSGIIQRNGILWVPNPVNPQENFADKWSEIPRKAELFDQWLESLERENEEFFQETDIRKSSRYLLETYGERDASAVMSKVANELGIKDFDEKIQAAVIGSATIKEGGPSHSRFDVLHRENPALRWPISLQYRVELSARASRAGFRTFNFTSGSQRLQKHLSLRFEAITEAPKPFDVYWQVVNTGEEAARAGGLRGSIFDGDLIRSETTLYCGFHWIECFIIKDGCCIARSGEFVVNIE